MRRIRYLFVLPFFLLPQITFASNTGSSDILILGTDNAGYVQVTGTQRIDRVVALL